MENLNLVLPEIFISLSIMFLLVLGVFKKNSSKITFNLSLFAIFNYSNNNNKRKHSRLVGKLYLMKVL